MKTREIIFYIICGLIVGLGLGFALGFNTGYREGPQIPTEIRNQMLDIEPYDASLPIRGLEYSNITPSGCTITFNTSIKPYGEFIPKNLYCEYTIYPSDIFFNSNVYISTLTDYLYKATIETYPEGGTVMFRIVEKDKNRGSLWFYIDLPRPDNSILPPPYMPTEKR